MGLDEMTQSPYLNDKRGMCKVRSVDSTGRWHVDELFQEIVVRSGRARRSSCVKGKREPSEVKKMELKKEERKKEEERRK